MKFMLEKPKTVRIGPFDYKYKEINTFASCGVVGECSFYTLEITVLESLPKGKKLEALIHEIVEGINEHNELNLDHHVIQTVSNNLTQVLLDNDVYSIVGLGKVKRTE